MKNYADYVSFLDAMGIEEFDEISQEMKELDKIFTDFFKSKPIELSDSGCPITAFHRIITENKDGCFAGYEWGGPNWIAWTPDSLFCVYVG